MILLKKENKNDIKTIEGQNAQIEGANITDFELKGDTYQQTYSGKNLLPNLVTTQTKSGVNITKNSDGSLTFNNTATAGINLNINYESGSYIHLESGEKYTISITNNSGIYFRLAKVSDGTLVASFDTPTKQTTFTSSYTGDVFAYLTILNGTSFSNLTIYPQIEKKPTATDYEPYVGGVPSPNPDYPQEIVSVTGLQNVTISNADNTQSNTYEVNLGKNLATENFNDSTTGIPLAKTIESGTQIYISSNVSGSIDRLYAYLDSTFAGNVYISYNNGKITYSGTPSFKFNRLRCPSGITCTESLVALGTATTYTPYFTPIELNKIVDYEDSIKKSSGKNLLDASKGRLGTFSGLTISYSNGEILLNGTSTALVDFYIATKVSTPTYNEDLINYMNTNLGTYTLSNNLGFENYFRIGGSYPQNTGTTTSTNKVDLIFVRIPAGTYNNKVLNIMLNEGSTALPYEPYRKVWYVEKKIGKIILDNTLNWQKSTTYSTDTYTMFFYNDETLFVQNYDGYCNRFEWGKTNDIRTGNKECVGNAGNSINIRILKSRLDTNDTNGLKTWLSNNDTIAYFILKTPIYEIITSEELINQLNEIEKAKLLHGENNIMITASDLVGTFKISYDNWYKFEKILRSGYNIKEDYDRITQKFINGRRKQILSDYKDCIIQLSLGTFDLETTVEYLKQLEDGEYEYYSFDDHEYKRANFLLEEKPEIIVANSLKEDEAEVEDFNITLLKAGE